MSNALLLQNPSGNVSLLRRRKRRRRPRLAAATAFPQRLSDLRRMQRILDALPFLVGYVDARGRYRFVNRAYERKTWFDVPRENLIGHTVRECVGEQEYEAIRPYVERVLAGETVHYQIASVYPQSAVSHREATYVPDIDPRSGGVRGYVVYVQDVSAQRKVEERLRWMALHDPLTGLPNRACLLDRMEAALAEAAECRAPLAVLYIDLDGFKGVNDSFGHDAGDRVLREMAKRLSDARADTEFVARLGGDEFAVLLPDIADSGTAECAARRFEQVLTEPLPMRGATFILRASIGAALFPEEGMDAAALIAAADRAMYAVKHASKI